MDPQRERHVGHHRVDCRYTHTPCSSSPSTYGYRSTYKLVGRLGDNGSSHIRPDAQWCNVSGGGWGDTIPRARAGTGCPKPARGAQMVCSTRHGNCTHGTHVRQMGPTGSVHPKRISRHHDTRKGTRRHIDGVGLGHLFPTLLPYCCFTNQDACQPKVL